MKKKKLKPTAEFHNKLAGLKFLWEWERTDIDYMSTLYQALQ